MKVYEIVKLIDGSFCNYLMNKVYSSKEDADKEIDRLIDITIYRYRNAKVIDNLTSSGGRNVQIVDKDDELKIYEWFGYNVLEVI